MDSYYSQEELNKLGIRKIGNNIKISKKASLYNCEKMEFGNDVRIDDFCVLSGKLVFGNNVHITCFALLAGADEGIYFSDFTTLAYRSSAFTRSDDYSGETLTNSTIPEKYRHKTRKEPIFIKTHAIIGANCLIMPGAHIEEGVSVGAFSLVVKPTEAWGVYVGIPAKRIKERSKLLLAQKEDLVRSRQLV